MTATRVIGGRDLTLAPATTHPIGSKRGCTVQEVIQQAAGSKESISVVIPVYNEAESIPALAEALFAVLDKLGRPFEVIAVNDGSVDGSQRALREVADRRREFKIIQFRINAGQTAAIMAGIDHAAGDIIVTLDADLQNDPQDIPLLLATLDEGYDLAAGWRVDRQDSAIRRNFISRVANRVISRISGVKLHDYGCTLKAYRKDVLSGMRLYGEMHRFVPIYVSWMGAKFAELPVRHHARKFGKSKYGLERTLKVILDLIVVKFFSRYLVKPIYVFGGFAALSFAVAAACLAFILYLKFAEGVSMIQTPLPVLMAMLVLVGIMSILMGLIAEILIRTYFESQSRRPYHIRDKHNFPETH